MSDETPWASGRCACGQATFRLATPPLIVHACHCRDCQRITGSPFVVNVWIESDHTRVEGERVTRRLPTGSGKGQDAEACASCGCIVLTRYLASPSHTVFVRGVCFDDPSLARPDVHIFTRSKVSWLTLPEDARAFDAFYPLKEVWAQDSLERLRAGKPASS